MGPFQSKRFEVLGGDQRRGTEKGPDLYKTGLPVVSAWAARAHPVGCCALRHCALTAPDGNRSRLYYYVTHGVGLLQAYFHTVFHKHSPIKGQRNISVVVLRSFYRRYMYSLPTDWDCRFTCIPATGGDWKSAGCFLANDCRARCLLASVQHTLKSYYFTFICLFFLFNNLI